jgi:hypothetical protein
MRWVHVDPDFGLGVYPIIFNPTAGKFERMHTILIDNSQMHPPVGRHRVDYCNKMPHSFF